LRCCIEEGCQPPPLPFWLIPWLTHSPSRRLFVPRCHHDVTRSGRRVRLDPAPGGGSVAVGGGTDAAGFGAPATGGGAKLAAVPFGRIPLELPHREEEGSGSAPSFRLPALSATRETPVKLARVSGTVFRPRGLIAPSRALTVRGGRRFGRPAGEIALVLAPADQITEGEPNHAGNQHRGEGVLRGILADVLS